MSSVFKSTQRNYSPIDANNTKFMHEPPSVENQKISIWMEKNKNKFVPEVPFSKRSNFFILEPKIYYLCFPFF